MGGGPMAEPRTYPWAGMTLLALAVIGMLMAHVGSRAVVAVAVVWLVSLWLPAAAPAAQPVTINTVERPDLDGLARAAMRAAIEPINMPLVLADSTRIIAANMAARAALGGHVVGQDARVSLRHPDAVRLLDKADGGSVTVRGLIGGRSLWQLTKVPVNDQIWAIELRDRTGEADMSRAHTDFVANASHELRTPLASIIGYVETLADDPARIEPVTAARFLGIVLREARRMQGLVGDLMSLSMLEAEKHDAPT